MPTYTIQEDPPWMSNRTSQALTASSVYSDGEDDEPYATTYLPSRASLDHSHPQHYLTSSAPQAKSSRPPIFEQVRSMLHKPTPTAYVSPYEAAFKTKRRSPERQNMLHQPTSATAFPQEEAVRPTPPLIAGGYSPLAVSQASPVTPVSTKYDNRAPTPLSTNERRQPAMTPSNKSIKRKPTPSTASISHAENVQPRRSSSVNSDWTESLDDDDQQTQSTWTTYAPSVAPSRPSADPSRHSLPKYAQKQAQASSHFSWSTIGTNVSHLPPPASPPPGPPPPIPEHYNAPSRYQPPRGPPVQSILSRRRPVQRMEQEEWAPPLRKSSTALTPRSATPNSTTTQKHIHPALRTHSPVGASMTKRSASSPATKQLPPPPELTTMTTQLSHLESLLVREKDLMHQRKNVERVIAELVKVEKASPLEVPYTTVRDAKEKLKEYRRRLEEVLLEERDVGIAITRARRKEGEEEGTTGLWVRRVTG